MNTGAEIMHAVFDQRDPLDGVESWPPETIAAELKLCRAAAKVMTEIFGQAGALLAVVARLESAGRRGAWQRKGERLNHG